MSEAPEELTLFELKEKAKWSFDNKEKKLAITGMLSHGAGALSSLEEISTVTAHEEIRAAAIAAIKSIADRAPGRPMELQLSEHDGSAVINTSEKMDKKKPKETQSELVASKQLADLPP